jgi:hypothetical protein
MKQKIKKLKKQIKFLKSEIHSLQKPLEPATTLTGAIGRGVGC